MGYNKRGKRDGTGPYKSSYNRKKGSGRRNNCWKRKKRK